MKPKVLPEEKGLFIRVTEDEHNDLRLLASESNRSVTAYIKAAIKYIKSKKIKI